MLRCSNQKVMKNTQRNFILESYSTGKEYKCYEILKNKMSNQRFTKLIFFICSIVNRYLFLIVVYYY